MQHVYPDYYKNFRCIADKCLHNCCIGWEIDIDSDTAQFYNNYSGDFGNRLRENIDFSADTPFFVLKENERCPFLNSKNLCDIIIETGEKHLCSICAEHPRFHNELPERVESGLGLCCEEATRIILSKKDTVQLIYDGSDNSDDEIINLRDKVITVLQDRSLSIEKRTDKVLAICNTSLPCMSMTEWAEILLSLERLDEKWTDILLLLKEKGDTADLNGFSMYMKDRQTEYEQLALYFIYRHFANAPDFYEAGVRACFAVLCYNIIKTMGAVIWEKQKAFSLEDQIELCRMFSSEIEYSDENLYVIFDKLS